MGAGQSSNGREGQSTAEAAKTSYYELLGIERTATDDEIKKAYRRKALELHPDRNYGDVERTTALFAEIQAAYEVLSDPQERAWYDSHEDAILNNVPMGDDGGDGSTTAYEHNVGMTSADDITRMFRNFNANIDFSDAPSGFYGFLREAFAKLAREEQAAAARDDVAAPDYPDFGHAADDHDYVKGFYSMWAGFSTRKSFAWRDRYRVTDAEDRRMRRLMEKENKRFRAEGIAEFNDAVRSLIAFVRKRDPRYTPNTQSEEERQQTLRDAAKAQAARMRAANQAKMNQEVPEWTRTRDPEEEDEEDPFAEESEEEQFECVACRKVFKSENQFTAHERSKKHTKAVQALRRRLQKEGVALDLDGDEEAAEPDDTDVAEPGDADVAEPGDADVAEPGDADVAESGDADVADAVAEKTADMGLEDAATATEAAPPHDDQVAAQEQQDESDSDASANSNASIPSTTEDTFAAPSLSPHGSTQPTETTQSQTPKLGKAAQKRAKRAAQQAAAVADENPHKCAFCQAGFSSKTRLFQHIDDLDHAVATAPAKNKSKAKGKRR